MRIVAVIQARTGSTRLPGKVLQDLAGETMLARVIRRTQRAERLSEVVVATTTSGHDDPVVSECVRLGVGCFRGSEHDVLDRYYLASEAFRADAVVRVTSDCPLIDPGLIDRVVGTFLGASNKTTACAASGTSENQSALLGPLEERPDYVSNFHERTYPRGLDNEVFTFDGLARAWCEADRPYQRVHVTPYFYENPELFRLMAVTHDQDLSDHRWTVDTSDDMEFARTVYDRLGDDEFTWRDVLDVLEREPQITAINQHVRQKELRDEHLGKDERKGNRSVPLSSAQTESLRSLLEENSGS